MIVEEAGNVGWIGTEFPEQTQRDVAQRQHGQAGDDRSEHTYPWQCLGWILGPAHWQPLAT